MSRVYILIAYNDEGYEFIVDVFKNLGDAQKCLKDGVKDGLLTEHGPSMMPHVETWTVMDSY